MENAVNMAKPSAMQRKFLNDSGDFLDLNIPSFRRQYCFFYGTLMDPSTLAKVLGISYRPTTRPATVTGYKCKLWGQYPALVDGHPGKTVSGVAYEIQSQDEKTKLETYEGDSYALEGCLIKFEDGSRVLGLTFKWKGDLGVLGHGSFDLRDWQMRDFA